MAAKAKKKAKSLPPWLAAKQGAAQEEMPPKGKMPMKKAKKKAKGGKC